MRKAIAALCLLSALFLLSCGEKAETDTASVYKIYNVNNEETKIFSTSYTASGTERGELIEELLTQLGKIPDKLEYKAPLAGNFNLLDYSYQEGQLVLNFDEHYKEQPPTTEILVRAAVVKTMTQIEGVDHLSFLVNSEPLTDKTGNIVGMMSADMFINNAGNEINSYERVKLRLYFANKAGDGLVEVNRAKTYNSNMSMEKLVVEEVIKGPNKSSDDQEIYPSINPETKILGVTVKDGICYVNLDGSFLLQIYNVTAEVTIYSLVNSLVELPNVNKVQIAVNGDVNVMFRESISLSNIFERKLELTKKEG